MNALDRFESVPRNSVLRAPVVFDHARGSELFDESGNRYIDFCAGGGSLGYGHNDAAMRDALIDYLSSDRVTQTCDRSSVAKQQFIESFAATVLKPRDMDYRILLTDPASGSATEVALRLVRRHTNRKKVVAFTSSRHGITAGSLAVTSKYPARADLGTPNRTTFMPFSGFFGEGLDTIDWLQRGFEVARGGQEHPAAVIVETIQVDGGVHVAPRQWLEALGELCREHKILLIADDSLTGCGATGSYFSFEGLRFSPDLIVVSNAIAGGLPMSMLLLRSELDSWRPGERRGELQGNGLALAAATALLRTSETLPPERAARNSRILSEELAKIAARSRRRRIRVRGKGMIWGVDFGRSGSAAVVSSWALERGVIVEPASIRDEVLLVRPAVTIDETTLCEGLDRLDEAVSDFLNLE